jgi:hypothetical protein
MSIRKPYHTPDEIIAQIDLSIKTLDLDAFRTDGRTQLYSGPHGIVASVFNALYGAGKWLDNHDRAFKQAAWELTKLIDQTKIGEFVEHYDQIGIREFLNVYQYFNHWAKEDPTLTNGDPDWAFKCADRVMRHTSKKFAEAISGDTFTAVCGAGLNKVFFEVELPALVANFKVTSINGVPMDLVRDLYNADPYQAFRLICIAELQEVKQNAQKTGKKEDWDDYKTRRKFFALERTNRRATAPAPMASALATMTAHKAAITGAGGPHRPAAPGVVSSVPKVVR